MLKNLQSRLEDSFKKLRGMGRIREEHIEDSLREIRLALLEADVEIKVAKDFIERIKDKALGQEVIRGVNPAQQVTKIFEDELSLLLGGETKKLDLNKKIRLLLVGLNGAGKTTTAAKLANFIKKQGRQATLVACDLYRPAAVEQLKVLAKQIDAKIFAPEIGEKDPVAFARRALKTLERQGDNILIFDTAGRQDANEELIAEIKEINDLINPTESLLVVDAATGQQAAQTAKVFDQAVGLNGVILAKLDGDARGGAALSMRASSGVPIMFAGVGEKLYQLEVFDPERMAGRILGMGDVVGLVETAAEAIEEEEAQKLAKRLQKRKFDFEDFLAQIRMMKKMGSLSSIMDMMPSMGKQLKDKDIAGGEKKLQQTEAIILSMTPFERSRPVIIRSSRKRRIAKGSGTSLPEVNRLLRQFAKMQKMMKNRGLMNKLMAQMGNGGDMKDLVAKQGGGGKAVGKFLGS